jgi:hypothetical protein
MCCPRLMSLIFPPTVYHGHELLPLLLGNERQICYVGRVDASWNVSKRAWVHQFVWLDKLRQFQKLNCRTMYITLCSPLRAQKTDWTVITTAVRYWNPIPRKGFLNLTRVTASGNCKDPGANVLVGYWLLQWYAVRRPLTRKKNSVVWVRKRTIPTERPPLLGEVIANFCG